MIYFRLFLSFAKIGFTSVGALSMIPLISSEMVSHGWMTQEEVSNIVAIAEMTPGPLGLNCATYAGIHAAGILGAIAANLGVLTPTLTTSMFVAVFFEKFKKSNMMSHALVGIRPVCVGLIWGVAIELARSNYSLQGELDILALLIGALALFLLLKFKLSVPKTIGISSVAGLILYYLI